MPMNRITTVIFDMYETLVENGPHLWQATFGDIVRQQQLDTTAERLWQEWRTIESEFRDSRVKPGALFRNYYHGWRDSFANAFGVLGLTGDPGAASRKSILDLSQRRPYPETREALGLVQRQWRTAILSNADDDFLLPNVALLDLKFAAVLSSEGVRSYKPQPELFREMLRRLDVAPAACAYVGDRQFEDVQGAGGVGMHTVWINRSGASPDPELPIPGYQISSLLELPQVLTGESPAKDGT